MKLNISIDDICPHPKSSDKVLEQCFRLIDFFPEIKFTLFIPSAYWRTLPNPDLIKYDWSPNGSQIDQRTKSPLYLDLFPNFCDTIKNLNTKNFEVGYHGHFHGVKNVSNNDEFEKLDYNEAKDIIKNMFQTVSKAGLDKIFKPIFRPPGWKMSAYAIKAAEDMGIKTFALGSFDYALKSYQGQDKQVKTVYETCSPPISPIKFVARTEITYHACEWLNNYFSVEHRKNLYNSIKKNQEQIDFCFMEEMV